MEDHRKPNFICLLDVRLKSARLVRRHRKARTQTSITFTLAVELNTLLTRNRTIRVMEMIRDNMVSILHSRRPKEVVGLERMRTFTTQALKRYEFSKNEVFIVFLTLLVLEFLFNNVDLVLEFLKDESYSILVLCGLMEEVESYVRDHIRRELNRDRSLKINKSHEAQASPPAPVTVLEVASSRDSTLNSTVNSSPESSLDGKSSATEMDSSFDDLKRSQSFENIHHFSEDGEILHESALDSYYGFSGSTISKILPQGEDTQLLQAVHFDRKNEHDEFLTELNNLRHNDPLNLEIDEEIDTTDKEIGLEVCMSPVKPRIHYQSLKSPLKSPSKRKNGQDLDNVENLENSDLHEITDLKDLKELDPDQYDHSKKLNMNDSSRNQINLTRKDLINLTETPFLLHSPTPLLHNTMQKKLLALSLAEPVHTEDEFPFSPPSLYKNLSKKSLTSSMTGRDDDIAFAFSPPPLRKTLSKKSLHSSITQPVERDDELAFAFVSEDAPNYIRQDKKFKFIRVGKVQKLVNLFEESVKDESSIPSRCSSPAK